VKKSEGGYDLTIPKQWAERGGREKAFKKNPCENYFIKKETAPGENTLIGKVDSIGEG